MDKIKGFGETDVYPSGEVKARRNWPKFTRPFGFRLADTHFVKQPRPMDKHRTRYLPRGLPRHPRNRTDFE